MNFVNKYVLPYLKAHVAGLTLGFGLLWQDMGENIDNIGNVTHNQWLAAVVATGVLGGAVAAIVNKPFVAPAAAPVVAPAVQDDGASV